MNFDNYQFRAHMVSKLLTGTIGLTDDQKIELQSLRYEKKHLKSISSGRSVKWTPTKQAKLKELNRILREKPLPKTLQTELRKIYRSEKHKRNFSKTNKYVEKGIIEEDEGITVYQRWKALKGQPIFFRKNTKRLFNEYFQGEADLTDTNDFENCKEGFDTKLSYELETFPFPEDELDPNYKTQNLVYIDLSNARKWTTAYVLVNCSEGNLWREKQKYWYAYGQPQEGDPTYPDYLKKARDTEIRLVFDRARFEKINPGFDFDVPKEEWYKKGYDIPLEDRVIEFVTFPDKDKMRILRHRCKISRKYLNKLAEQDGIKS